MWDLSSLTRDRTQAPALEVQSPNHWTSKEVPQFTFFYHTFSSTLVLVMDILCEH